MTNRNLAVALASAVSIIALSLASTSEGQVTQKPPPQVTKVAAKPDLTLGPSLAAWRDGVHSEATKRELSIGNLEISVDVRGDIAETTVTASFDNPSNDQLEGNFQLNMARNAVVTGYALDINGTLIDGVLESKYKAAEAYQRRVNRRIDPGLAEVDYSDRFETRIYPIPAHGSRIIRLRMVSQFDPNDGYVLPLTIPGKVKHLSMKVNGEVKIAASPVALPSGQTAIEAENATLKGALKLTAAERPSPMLVSQHPGAENFFDILAPAPSAAATWRHPLHIFWDRSVSRADDELAKEAQLAEDYANKRGVRRVKLTMFDSGKVDTIDVDTDRISETLGAIHYRGGTSYAMLSAVTPSMDKDAECLMFSDGRVSIDDRTNFSLPCAVSTITSGPESDRAWLSDVSERTGGISLTLTKTNSADLLTQLTRPDARILGVTDGSGHALEAVRIAADPRNFHIVGPMPDDGVVVVKMAGEASPRRFQATSSRTPTFAGPGALWARQRLGVEASERKPDELAAMARKYNVATPQASFVVLESPQDYVQAKIAPPANYPKQLQASYASMKASAEASLGRAKEARLTEVVSIWNDQKKWWTTKYTGKPLPGTEKDGVQEDRLGAAANSAAPPPPPPPPPAAMRPEAPRPAMAAPGDRDAIVVTGSRASGGAQGVPVALANEAKADDEAEANVSSDRAGSISVADWNVNRPYLDRLDKAGANWEAQIDKEMPKEGAIPLFWFDIAEWHWRAGRKEEARRATEAALDLPTRDSQTLQIAAQRLIRYGSYDRAVWLLEKLMDAETDRPQPMRALANALIERAKYAKTTDASKADLSRAIALLAKVATGVFEEQPARGVETVSLMEANNALAKLKNMGGTSNALDPRLVALLDADVRVVMEWNTPRTDLDLWVTEPKGAKVGYSSPMSPWGGKLSGDVTNGYGPEEYLIRVANAGTYDVRAKTFASDRSNPNGPSTLTVHLIRNWGRPGQSEQVIDIEMPAEDRGELAVGKFKIE